MFNRILVLAGIGLCWSTLSFADNEVETEFTYRDDDGKPRTAEVSIEFKGDYYRVEVNPSGSGNTVKVDIPADEMPQVYNALERGPGDAPLEESTTKRKRYERRVLAKISEKVRESSTYQGWVSAQTQRFSSRYDRRQAERFQRNVDDALGALASGEREAHRTTAAMLANFVDEDARTRDSVEGDRDRVSRLQREEGRRDKSRQKQVKRDHKEQISLAKRAVETAEKKARNEREDYELLCEGDRSKYCADLKRQLDEYEQAAQDRRDELAALESGTPLAKPDTFGAGVDEAESKLARDEERLRSLEDRRGSLAARANLDNEDELSRTKSKGGKDRTIHCCPSAVIDSIDDQYCKTADVNEDQEVILFSDEESAQSVGFADVCRSADPFAKLCHNVGNRCMKVMDDVVIEFEGETYGQVPAGESCYENSTLVAQQFFGLQIERLGGSVYGASRAVETRGLDVRAVRSRDAN